jgi:putative transposase
MPRRARLAIPDVPLHIIQRGVNRCAVFMDADDYRHYLKLLRQASEKHGIDVHAYVLMGNHTHLLVTSHESGAISAAMHRLGQCYVQAFNHRHRRTGTLWDGRFKSCLVDTDSYLLTVYRYIELNPVRAAMIDRPDDYPWSSAQGNLGIRADPALTPHPVFRALAADRRKRARVYAKWLMQGSREAELAEIRKHVQQEKALGSKRFQAMVRRTVGRDVSWRPRGRPPREPGI